MSRRRDMKPLIGLMAAAGAQACLLVGAADATVPTARLGATTSASTVARVVPWNPDADAASVHLAQRRRSTAKEEAPRDAGPRTMAVSPCARDYHAGMTEILQSFEPSLNASLESARTIDASISGNWMFHNPALKQRMVRVCAEPSTSGPARCLKWEMRPAAATGGPMTPATPSASEFKLIRAVEEFVRLRGLISDLAKSSGRFDSITVRVADDLTAYLSQPQHPAMCTGGVEFTDFMISNTRTYRARMQEVLDTDKSARALARSRVAQLAAAAMKAVEPAPRAASPTGDATAPLPAPAGQQTVAGVPGSDVAPSATATAPPPAPTPAPRPDISKVPPDYAGMIAELGRHIVRDGERSPADDGVAPLEQLARIQEWLRGGAASSLADEVRAPLLLALRAIETGIYAEAMQSRYGAVHEALFGSIAKLRELHKARCTCSG